MSLSPESRGVLLETLYPGSMYVAWVAARSPRGVGAPTAPLAVRTQPLGKCTRATTVVVAPECTCGPVQYMAANRVSVVAVVPAPKEIKTWPINTTAIRVEWKAPQAAENLTRGFLILFESPKHQVSVSASFLLPRALQTGPVSRPRRPSVAG